MLSSQDGIAYVKSFLEEGFFGGEGGGPNLLKSEGASALGCGALVFWTWDALITPNQSIQIPIKCVFLQTYYLLIRGVSRRIICN